MRIKRIYNNNVVMVEDQKSEEMIVIGKGLAFGKKAGEFLEEDRIEKVFTLAEKSIGNRLAKLVQEIPIIYLSIAEEPSGYRHLAADGGRRHPRRNFL